MASIFLLKSRMKTAKKEWNGRNRGFKAEEATITIIKYSSSFQKKKRRKKEDLCLLCSAFNMLKVGSIEKQNRKLNSNE